MIDFGPILQVIWQRYSGEAAWQAVSDLSGFHRIQASPGHRAAAGWLRTRLSTTLSLIHISEPTRPY